jgi:hypothetical protein
MSTHFTRRNVMQVIPALTVAWLVISPAAAQQTPAPFTTGIIPLAIGGVSWGFTFGASATDFVGTVSNIRRPSDVNGVYGAAGAGAAVGPGGGVIVLTNQNGAVLALSGRQVGLIVAADLNGLVISLR